MAISADNVSNAQFGSSGSGPFNYNHTVTSGANYLVVHVGYFQTNFPSSTTPTVTYNGVTMTHIGNSSGTNVIIGTWGLISPSSGTNSVSVSISGSLANDMDSTAMSFFGMNTSDPVPTTSTGNGTGDTTADTSITTQYANSWVLDGIIGVGTGVGSNLAVVSPQTRRGNSSSASTKSVSSSTDTTTSAGSVTQSWTNSSNFAWAQYVVELREDTAVNSVFFASNF